MPTTKKINLTVNADNIAVRTLYENSGLLPSASCAVIENGLFNGTKPRWVSRLPLRLVTGNAVSTCGQIAGAYYGESGIPVQWLDRLYMQAEIADLADKLCEREV